MAPGGRSRRPTILTPALASNPSPSNVALAPPAIPNVSQPVPSTTTGTSSVETNSTRKGRGKAKNISLAKQIETSGRRIRIEIPEGFLRPVGKGSKLFLSEVGIITRTYMPVTCLNWKMVKENHLQILYDHILDKFDIDLHIAHVKLAVNDYIKNRYKDHRHKFRTHFRKLGGNLTARNHPYDGIKEEDWVMLCNHFMDDKYQKRCKTNTDNRKKLEVNHFGGSKSFQQYREDLREKGEPHGMINVYEHTHYDPKKGWVHQKAKDNHDSMVAAQSEPISEGATPPTEEEICEKVLGPKAFFGHGVKPTSTSRLSQRDHIEMEQSNKRAEAAEKRNDELVQQLQDMQHRQSQMELQLQAILASHPGSTPTS